jgi:hypothetical protein
VNLNVPVLLGFAFLDRGLFTCADHDAVVALLFPVIERKSARLEVAVDVKPSSPSPSARDRSTVTAGSCAVFDSRPPQRGWPAGVTSVPMCEELGDGECHHRQQVQTVVHATDMVAFAAWVLQWVAMAARYRMSSQRRWPIRRLGWPSCATASPDPPIAAIDRSVASFPALTDRPISDWPVRHRYLGDRTPQPAPLPKFDSVLQ